jgi:hypothetical protein
MGRLHDRMTEDLSLRNFGPTTQRNYLARMHEKSIAN